ncbi:MAG: OadG family protein [Synergistaceae bacterium]
MEGHIASYFTGVSGGLTMSMIAFSIVFIVITGLMLTMMGMKHICAWIDGIGKPKPTKKETTTIKETSSNDDGELLAIITAAIVASCGKAVRIISYAPVREPSRSPWKFASKMNNVASFID